jgi:hypothetical protein
VRKVARPDPPSQVTSVTLAGFVDVVTIFQGAETVKCGHGVNKAGWSQQSRPLGAPISGNCGSSPPDEGDAEHTGLDHLPHVSAFIADWVTDTFAELPSPDG